MSITVMKQALEALESFSPHNGIFWRTYMPDDEVAEAITSLRVAIASYSQAIDAAEQHTEAEKDKFCDENCTWADHHVACKYSPHALKLEGDIVIHHVEQKPVATIKGFDGDGAVLRWHVKSTDFPAGTPLYTHPQPKVGQEPKRERNFCERCGKRLFDGIHTCTPPAAHGITASEAEDSAKGEA